MSRIKRGYQREIPPDELKRDYRLFAIACEGSKREKDYFELLKGISQRVIVEYIKDEEYENGRSSSPEHVLRRAEEYAEKANLNDEDSIWLVMDVDKWGDKKLKEVHNAHSKNDNWHTIISNPCFEVWLLYHTKKNLKELKITRSKEFKNYLNEQIPGGYNCQKYILFIKDAMHNAKAADKSKNWYPDPGQTKVYCIIEKLLQFVSKKEFDSFIERIKSSIPPHEKN